MTNASLLKTFYKSYALEEFLICKSTHMTIRFSLTFHRKLQSTEQSARLCLKSSESVRWFAETIWKDRRFCWILGGKEFLRCGGPVRLPVLQTWMSAATRKAANWWAKQSPQAHYLVDQGVWPWCSAAILATRALVRRSIAHRPMYEHLGHFWRLLARMLAFQKSW